MVRALSLTQPWADAVLYAGKRIENRIKWKNSNFRGAFLIHAAKGCTKADYADVVSFLERRRIEWRPPPYDALVRGGIVGVASVEGIVLPTKGGTERVVGSPGAAATFALQRDSWWMGAFALLLDGVRAVPFVEHPGSLGFFRVPDDVARRALGADVPAGWPG